MALSFMTPGLSGMLRHQSGSFFWHTYTRTPRVSVTDNPSTVSVDESLNDWGEQVYASSTAIPLQPCMYMQQDMTLVGPNGLVEINRPILLVPTSDPIQEGDLISNVRTLDKAGSVLLFAGPVKVENVTPVAPEFGGPVYKSVLLRQVSDL